jgi:hypothetical protein
MISDECKNKVQITLYYPTPCALIPYSPCGYVGESGFTAAAIILDYFCVLQIIFFPDSADFTNAFFVRV